MPFLLFGPSDRTRTCSILLPKNSGNFFLTISAPFWHLLFRKSCSLELSSPLSPCAPNPVMVKYVVKNRFPQNPGSGSQFCEESIGLTAVSENDHIDTICVIQ